MTKTALVSGGRSGIGAAIAVALAQRLGMRVIAAGLPAPSADPPAVEAVDLDVRDPAGIARLVAGLDRLDFTCIGPAVNLAARLEGLARGLGRSVVLSSEFAGRCAAALQPLGDHALRGVGRPQPAFGLPEEG